MDADVIHKVLVLGDSGVGKTRLIRSFECCGALGDDSSRATAIVDAAYEPTVSIGFTCIPLPERSCTLQFWDVPVRQESVAVYGGARIALLLLAGAQKTGDAVSNRVTALRRASPGIAVMIVAFNPPTAFSSLRHGVDAVTTVDVVSAVSVQDVFRGLLALLATPPRFMPSVTLEEPFKDAISCRLLMIGANRVGKTVLMQRYAAGRYAEEYVQTLGIDFSIKRLPNNGAKLQIWDTAGEARFAAIAKSYYRGARGYMLLYDITSRASLGSLRKLLSGTGIEGGATPCIVVGTKCDLDHLREVPTEEGSAYARSINALFVETSALECINVDRAFEALADRALLFNP